MGGSTWYAAPAPGSVNDPKRHHQQGLTEDISFLHVLPTQITSLQRGPEIRCQPFFFH